VSLSTTSTPGWEPYIPSADLSMFPANGLAILKTITSVSSQIKSSQRASFPPSTAMDAPVMKDALSDATNRMV